MKCTVCDALNREYDLMCEIEATLVLRQRFQLVSTAPAKEEEQDKDSGDLVLMSRKRQAQIVSKLESHRTLAHSA